MSNSGAQAALKGYRLQALYTLQQIIRNQDKKLVFQPEGNEDLTIFKDDTVVSDIQIKAYSDNLIFSNFLSTNQESSFFHRAINTFSQHANVEIKVISFGPIGPEIVKAWRHEEKDKQAVCFKLSEAGFNSTEVDQIISRIKWERVDENEIYDFINNYLVNSQLGGDPDNVLNILIFWLFLASENRTKITYEDLKEKIHSIGQYLSERANHYQEWFTNIQPISFSSILLKEDKEYSDLKEEFHQGISVRKEHVSADLDIIRDNYIKKITLAFAADCQTIILHGASGQGKTALAYRFFKDYLPNEWCYEIKAIEDRPHVLRVVKALVGHYNAIKIPLYIYLDVSPRDLDWEFLVQALLSHKNIKLLISIREEDLSRHTFSRDQLGSPQNIAISLYKSEAEQIFQTLREREAHSNYPSFEEAWIKFGGEGPLLEYIHFLTQTDTLKHKIKSQISRIQREIRCGDLNPDSIKLLHYCAIATENEARIDIGSLVKELEIKEPKSTLELFENEYLIRYSSNKKYIEALHPIRSSIIVDILSDEAFFPVDQVVSNILPHIVESDLETFLLYLFIRYDQLTPKTISSCLKLELKTWVGVAGIARALLWLGIKTYVSRNKEVILKAQNEYGAAWLYVTGCDIANVLKDDPSLEMVTIMARAQNNPEKLKEIEMLRSNMLPHTEVFSFLKSWLIQLPPNIQQPITETEWSGLAETAFWSGRLEINNESQISPFQLPDNLDLLPFSVLIDVYEGVQFGWKTLFNSTITPQRDYFINRFYKELLIISCVKSKDIIKSTFIIDGNLFSEKEKSKWSSTINMLAVKVAYVTHILFPNLKTYETQGVGHDILGISTEYDDSVKKMPPSLLFNSRLSRINSIYANYIKFQTRPKSWPEYTHHILKIRQEIISTLESMIDSINSYFKQKKTIGILNSRNLTEEKWEHTKLILNEIPDLPKSAVDPWGIITEQSQENYLSKNVNQLKHNEIAQSLLIPYTNYLKNIGEYFTNMRNFINQATAILNTHGVLGRVAKDEQQIVIDRAKSLGYQENLPRLSLMNLDKAIHIMNMMQESFRGAFKELLDEGKLYNLEEKEGNTINTAWAIWFQFAYFPQKHNLSMRKQSLNEISFLYKHSKYKLLSLFSNKNKTYRISILSENIKWEQKSALWLALHLTSDDLNEIDDIYDEVLRKLATVLSASDSKSLEPFIFDRAWNTILIVPLLDKTSLNNLIWRIPRIYFMDINGYLSEENQWIRMPISLEDSNIWEELGVFPKKSLLHDLKVTFSELYFKIMYFYSFAGYIEGLDSLGEEVLINHFSQKAIELQNIFDKTQSDIDSTKDCKSLMPVVDNDSFIELNEVLDFCYFCLTNGEAEKTGEVKLHLKPHECYEWALLIEQAVNSINVFENSLREKGRVKENVHQAC